MDLHIRWMIRFDLPEAADISRRSGLGWDDLDFLEALRQRNCIGFVAVHRGAVLGYMLYELFPDRLDLLALAVHPHYRRMGIGTKLVAKLAYKVLSHRREKLVAVADEHNDGAVRFFSRIGLRATGLERLWDTDGIRFEYRPTSEEWALFGGAPISEQTAQ